jgi:DNA-binding response OmpR family regulator
MLSVMSIPKRGHRVLALVSDADVAELVTDGLQLSGHVVETEADGQAGLRRALTDPPDLLVVESSLSPVSGLEVCRRLRILSATPLIMLVGELETDGIDALEVGADDYLAQPFSRALLTSRVGAVMRRTTRTVTGALPTHLRAGDLELDVVAHEARVRGRPVALSPKEFALLVHFMRNPRRVLTREELLRVVWGPAPRPAATVTVHVRWLRTKIEDDPSDPRHIKTVPRLGYRFEP